MLTKRLITQLKQQNSKQISVMEEHNSAVGEQSEKICDITFLLESHWR